MALTKVTGGILSQPIDLGITTATTGFFSGIVTAQSVRVLGDLTVDGSTTTLDTVVTEVDRLEVGANNVTVGVAITQSGTGDILRLYDGSNKEFSVTDGGTVYVSQSMAFQQSDRATTAGLLGRGSLLIAGTQQTDFVIKSNPHNSNLILGVGVTERLRITSSGQIGIGTDTIPTQGQFFVGVQTSSNNYDTQPTVRFAAETNGSATHGDVSAVHIGQRAAGSADPAIIFHRRTGSAAWQSWSSRIHQGLEKLHFGFSSFAMPGSHSYSDVMVLKRNTGVGIGTDNPGTDLHISGSGAGQNSLRIDSSGTAISFNNHSEFIGYMGNDSGKLYINAAGTERTLSLRTNYHERLRIDSSGRLQIGSSVSINLNQFNGPGRLNIQNNNNDTVVDFSQGIVFTDNNGDQNTWTHAGIVATGSSGYTGNLVFGTDSGPKSNSASGITEKMRILSDGRVAIGTDIMYGDSKINIRDNSSSNYRSLVLQSSATNGSTMIYIQNGTQVLSMGSGGSSNLSGSDLTHGLIRSEVATVFAVGDSEKLRITSDGRVGIGTDDPQQNLEIRGAGASVIRLTTNNNLSYTNLRQNQTGKYFEISPSSTSNQSFIVNKPNGDEAFRIKGDGNVGIGTNNPGALLNLYGTNSRIRLSKSDAAANVKHWDLSAQGEKLRLQAKNDANSGGGNLFDFYRVAEQINEFRGVKSGNTWFVVDNLNTKVGIGTDAPKEALHVKSGTGSGFNSTYNGRTVAIIEGDSVSGTVLSIMSKSSGYSGLFFGDESAEASGQIQYIHSSNSFKFNTSGGTSNLVLDNGNVGIGTDIPSSPLQVVSSANNIVQIRSTTRYSTMYMIDSVGSSFIQNDSGHLRFGTGGGANASGGEDEALRIDSNGRILIGHATTPAAVASVAVVGSYGASSNLTPFVYLCRDEDGTSISTNESLGQILFASRDGYRGAVIEANAAGAWSGSSSDGYLVFKTTPDNTTTPTEKLRIDSDGDLIHTSTNKTLSLVTTQNVAKAGTKIAFFGANRYTTDEEFASIKGELVNNQGGSGKQRGNLLFTVGNNSHKHIMTDGGNVGLGTDNPSQLLHLAADSAHKILLKRSGASPSEVTFGNEGNYAVISNNTNGIDLQTGSTPSSSMHIASDGKVGIGTVTPNSLLHLHQSSTSGFDGLRLTNSTTGVSETSGFSIELDNTEGARIWHYGNENISFGVDNELHGTLRQDGRWCLGPNQTSGFTVLNVFSTNGPSARFLSDNDAGISIYDDSDNSDVEIRNNNGQLTIDLDHSNQVTTEAFIIKVNGTSANEKELFRIDSDGKVGINTSSPDSRLTVAGTSGTTQIELKRLNSNASGTIGAINFTAMDGHSVANISAAGDGDNEGAKLIFRTTSAAGEHSPFGGSTIERLRINANGRVGIGTDDPASQLHVFTETGDCVLTLEADRSNSTSTENDNPYIVFKQDGSVINSAIGMNAHGENSQNNSLTIINGSSSGGIFFKTASSGGFDDAATRMKLTPAGEVLINETTARTYVDGAGNTQTPFLQVEDDGNSNTAISLRYNSGAGSANRRASFIFARTADGTAVSNNSVLGEVLFMGEGNSTLEKAASIRAEVDGTPGTNDMPGRLIFSTSADGSDSPTERLQISSAGLVTIKNFTGVGLKLEGSGSDYQGLQLQTTDSSASQTRNIFIDAVNETGAAVANQVGSIQSDGGSAWIWQTQPAGNRTDRRVERLRIDSSGNLTLTGSSSSSDPRFTIRHSNADTEGEVIRLARTDNTTIRYHSIKAMHGGAATNNYITFNLHDGSGSPHTQQAEVLRLVGNGRVGINTTVPQSRLHVFQGKSGFDYGTTGQLIVENDGNSTIQLLSPNTHTSSVHFGDNDNGMVGRIVYDHTNNNLSFWNQNNQRMTIDGGKVGIGSTLPSKTLDVVGDDGLMVRTTTNGGASNGGAIIKMTDQTPSDDQAGFIKYRHTDSASPGNNYGSTFFVTSETTNNAFVIGDFEHDNPTFNNDLLVKTNVGIGTHIISRGPLQIHSRSNNDVQIHMTNNETGVGSGNGFTIFGGAGTDGRDMGFVNRETTGAIEFYTNQNGTLTQRGAWHTGTDITTFCINTASTGTHSNFVVSNHDTTDYNGVADRNEFAIFSDIHFTGTDNPTGNRSHVGWRNDVENSITQGSNTSGNRTQVYGISSTLNSTKYAYILYGAYLFCASTADNATIAQTLMGCYGYAQGYSGDGTSKSQNIYGGHFIGYRGGLTNGGHCYGVMGRAQQTTNGSNKTGDMTGVLGEVEVDEGTVTNAYSFRAIVDMDNNTGSGHAASVLTTGYLYHGSYSTQSGTTVTNKRGIWLSGCTDNYLAGDLEISGEITKGSGTFRIPHPLPALKDTKDLVHSFIEGPQMDLIYRGKVDLVNGTATVNLDTKAGMTEGTFVLLNRDVQCFTTNETGWTNVKGSVTGNQLTIIAQENTCTDTISWMVIGERQDDVIKAASMTDNDGNLIVEPNQKPAKDDVKYECEDNKYNPDPDVNPKDE